MANLFSIQKQQEYPIFGRFNTLYGDNLVEYCRILNEFQISILTVEEYKSLPEGTPQIEDIETDSFAYYIQKEGDTADTTNAGIVFNSDMIDFYGFNESEQLACVAHEIGHILYFFLDNKDNYPPGQGEEIYADSIAIRIGLSAELLSAIGKIERSGIFNDTLRRFGMRKVFLNHSLVV